MSGSPPSAADSRGTVVTKARGLLGGVHPANLLAAAAVLLSGALLLHWLSRLIFWRDEWEFLLHRRSWNPNSFFDPWVEELLAIPVSIYKVLVTTFGMESAAPYQVIAVLLFLLSVVMMFVYVRRRVGEWLALASMLPILFFGSSWDDLLFPFQMALFGSIACGIGALLALERRDRRGDLGAMVLLIGTLFFFDLGIAFVAAATLELAMRSDRFRRAFVVAVPTGLWLLWYAGWGHTANTYLSFHNVANLPNYVLDGLASTVAALFGLAPAITSAQSSPLDWGQPLLILAIVLGAWRLYTLGRVPDRVLVTLAALLGFWSLTALNAHPLAPATAHRYQYIGAILLVLVAAELGRGAKVGRWPVVIILAVAGASALSNGWQLRDWARTLAGYSQQERGGLAALELARDRVDPHLELTEENSDVEYLGLLDAGSYLSAVDAYGSPAYSPAELATAPENARVAADKVSGAALAPSLTRAVADPGGPCVLARPGTPITLPPAGLVLLARAPGTQVSLRRYASQSFPVALGPLPPDSAELLRITPDQSPRAWTFELSGPPARICRP